MAYDIAAILALTLVGFLLFLILFERGIDYHVTVPKLDLAEDAYLCLLAALSDAQIHRDSKIEVLTNGQTFYPAILDAIRAAKHHVNLEAYIFAKGDIAQQYVDALTERARAGVKVKVVLDYIGAFATPDSFFDTLRAAGGEIKWYQPLRWYTFKRMNNRTHRELLVVDGKIGFIGGAGVSDVWWKEDKGEPPWRDTYCRVEGPLVTGLQTTFAENWLEASEEILAGEDYFPRACLPGSGGGNRGNRSGDDRGNGGGGDDDSPRPGDTRGFVVISAPSAGRSTRARILFQTLLASAKKSIHINSPYFMPDTSARREICRAVARGVEVKIITPGPHADHSLTRASGRARYGELLKCGAQIREYQPAMIHRKILIVDGEWAVVGSTNFDNRSFGINDEVNLAAQNPRLAARLEQDFERDLAEAKLITYDMWKHRPLKERLIELAGRLIERQQ